MEVQVQEHRNGVRSILVEITSIKDEKGNETNFYYSKGRGPGTKLNLVEGEARRLIDSGRAKAVSDEKPKPKPKPKPKGQTKAKPKAMETPSNKMGTATSNK